MGTFIHTPDNQIIINGTIFPLAFFMTVEGAYALPSGMICQEYIQGDHYKASSGSNDEFYSLPWADGDTYISSLATYVSAYVDYNN